MQPQTPAARLTPLVPRPPPAPDAALDHDPADRSPDPSLTVAAVARRLGIAPATLRTWDRRYGIGPTSHVPGRHRRYTADDLARLELMRAALLHGATPAVAAEHALTAALTHTRAGPPAPPDTAAVAEHATPLHFAVPRETRATAGDVEAVLWSPDGKQQVRGLARAATALDAEAVRRLLRESIAAVGAQVTWDVVVRPVLSAVAQRWVDTGEGIEVEHLLSDCVIGVFSALAAATPIPTAPTGTARPVLLAGMAGDQHRLPMVVLSATLAQRGVTCRSLGTDLPAAALVAAIRRTAPAAILLWSQLSDSADPDLLDSLPRTRPGFRTFVAGPGWAEVVLRPQIVRLSSLREATDVISALTTA